MFFKAIAGSGRLTHDILECINTTLQPKGVAVVIEASHMCMMMQGFKNRIV